MTKDQLKALAMASRIENTLATTRQNMDFFRGDLRVILKALDKMAAPKASKTK